MGVEESLKTTADALKKQLKDEAHARTVLQVSEDNTALRGATDVFSAVIRSSLDVEFDHDASQVLRAFDVEPKRASRAALD